MNIITNEKMEISANYKSVPIRESDELSYCKSTWRGFEGGNNAGRRPACRAVRINIYYSTTNKLIKYEKGS